jgi:glycolate oxidase
MSALRESSADGARAGGCRRALAASSPPVGAHRARGLKPYECDGLSAYRETPLVPPARRRAQVARVLAGARADPTPVVARGSGTGLSGGALPLADGILLSLARFNRMLAVDPAARRARVQPGVTNLRISQHVAPLGLYYAPDPSSQIACSIGGNVAENSGGVHCLKYGLTVHNVARVRAMTIEGDCSSSARTRSTRRLRPARARSPAPRACSR